MPRTMEATGPDGRTLQFDWYGDTDPTDAELDEIFANAPPPKKGLLGRGWEGLKKGFEYGMGMPASEAVGKLTGHEADTAVAAEAMKATPTFSILDPLGGVREKVMEKLPIPESLKGVAGFVTQPLMRNPSQMLADSTLFDFMSAGAGAKGQIAKEAPAAVRQAINVSRALEVAGGLGLSSEALYQIKGALESGDYSSIPPNVMKAIMGGMMLSSNHPTKPKEKGPFVPDFREPIPYGPVEMQGPPAPTMTEAIPLPPKRKKVPYGPQEMQGPVDLSGRGAEPLPYGPQPLQGPIEPPSPLPVKGTKMPKGGKKLAYGPQPLQDQPQLPPSNEMEQRFATTLEEAKKNPLSLIEEPSVSPETNSQTTGYSWFDRSGKQRPLTVGDNKALTERVKQGNWVSVQVGPKTIQLKDSTNSIPTDQLQMVLEQPHTMETLSKYNTVLEYIQREIPLMDGITLEGAIFEPTIRGVNRGQKNISVNPYNIAAELLHRVKTGSVSPERAPLRFGLRLMANAVHEAAHRMDPGHGEEFQSFRRLLRGATAAMRKEVASGTDWRSLYSNTVNDTRQLYATWHRAQKSGRGAGVVAGVDAGVPRPAEMAAGDHGVGTGGVGDLAPQPPNPEGGFVTLGAIQDAGKTLKQSPKAAGELIRASAVGQLGVAIRNIYSGLRMTGKAMVESPLASASARTYAAIAKAKGDMDEYSRQMSAAKAHWETMKAFPRATLGEAAATVADAIEFLSAGRVKMGSQAFNDRLSLMAKVGDKKTAKRLSDFSTADLTARNALTKFMMFGNIMGDRFINRTFLRAHTDALEKMFGVSGPAQLEALAAQNPKIRTFLEDYLAQAGGEAFKASWQHVSPKGTAARTLAAKLDNSWWGIFVHPFAKAVTANLIPNIVEQIPILANMSKRVKNSLDYDAYRRMLQTNQTNPTLTKNQVRYISGQMKKLKMDGIYSKHMILARQAMGPLVVAAAIAQRLSRGDDGTEFDELPTQKGPDGRATEVSSVASSLGEDLPYAFIGDYIAHKMIAQQTGKPFRYEGKEGTIALGQLAKALYGSRTGYENPAVEMAAQLVTSGEVADDWAQRLITEMGENVGRMAGQGAWMGEGYRRLKAWENPEDAQYRRSDLGKNPVEGFKLGLRSQIPGLREDLPLSPQWKSLKYGEQRKPIESLTGDPKAALQSPDKATALGNLLPALGRTAVPELERFMRKQPLKVGWEEVLPRRTDNAQFDDLMLKNFREGVEKRVLPTITSPEKLNRMTPEQQSLWFKSVMKEVRSAASKKSIRDFKKTTGSLPPRVQEKKDEVKERKKTLREAKRALRGGVSTY